MRDITDRIAKLLQLSSSPNEHEARAALLKAQQLMAQHKLDPEDIRQEDDKKVVVETIGLFCTAITDPWICGLAAVLAKHFCCKAYRNHKKFAKRMEIGLAGLEADFQICKHILLYACDCVRQKNSKIRASARSVGYRPQDIRKMCDAYGYGFVSGLQDALDEQLLQHQEWGLALTVPQVVYDATAHQRRATAYGMTPKLDGWSSLYAAKGYEHGKAFGTQEHMARSQKKPEDAEKQFTAQTEIPASLFRHAQKMLAITDFSDMDDVRRKTLGIRENSEEELAFVRYPDGMEIFLKLCSGCSRYYISVWQRTSEQLEPTELPEYAAYTLHSSLRLELRGKQYLLEIKVAQQRTEDTYEKTKYQ